MMVLVFHIICRGFVDMKREYVIIGGVRNLTAPSFVCFCCNEMGILIDKVVEMRQECNLTVFIL